jgi:hypothetical protein
MTGSHATPEAMRGLLGRYGLAAPVPDEHKKIISGSMARVLSAVLKRGGMYSLPYGIFLALYFFLKKFGITLTAAKTAVLVTMTASVSAGGYYIYQSDAVRGNVEVHENRAIAKAPATDGTVMKHGRVSAPVITYTLGIEPLSSSSVDRKTLGIIAEDISRRISGIRGANYTGLVPRGGSRGLRYRMLGNVEKLDDAYMIFVKVINTSDSSIIYAAKEKAGSAGEIGEACDRLAKKIAAGVR